MAHAVGVHHMAQLCGSADFVPGGLVEIVCWVGEAYRVEDMHMAVDLGLCSEVHGLFGMACGPFVHGWTALCPGRPRDAEADTQDFSRCTTELALLGITDITRHHFMYRVSPQGKKLTG